MPLAAAMGVPGGALAALLVAAYLVLIAGGFVVFRTPWAMRRGSEMSTQRAAFTAANAGTLTGFQISVSVNDYQPAGRSTVLLLTVVGSLVSMIVGSMALVRILRLPYSDGQVITAALVAQGLALLAGTSLLTEFGQDFFATVMQAAAAFGNSGIYAGKLSGAGEWRLQMVQLPLAFLGGLGLPVLMEIYDRAFGGRRMSVHSRTVVAMSAGLYAAAVVVFVLLQWPGEDGSWRRAVAESSAAAVDCRTAGIALHYVHEFPRTMQWLMIPLMAVGASPAGTGGGVKTTTVAALILGAHAALKGRRVGRVAGIAAVWVGAYGAIVLVSLLVLLWSEPQAPADRLVFLAVSAASNVGLSHEPVSLSAIGLYTLTVAMLVGRLAPMGVLWWTAMTTGDAELAVG